MQSLSSTIEGTVTKIILSNILLNTKIDKNETVEYKKLIENPNFIVSSKAVLHAVPYSDRIKKSIDEVIKQARKVSENFSTDQIMKAFLIASTSGGEINAKEWGDFQNYFLNKDFWPSEIDYSYMERNNEKINDDQVNFFVTCMSVRDLILDQKFVKIPRLINILQK
ncbi:MAG: hypothetical protein H0T62_13985 [Parachlamydiaceae bacterium]|nr:hypothetical protein [Parachlamydiaceae bacterium]